MPDAPGSNKSILSKINKPSKKRVTVHLQDMKALGDNFNCYSDMGGDGGEFLLDEEQLKKLNDATGSTAQAKKNQISSVPIKK